MTWLLRSVILTYRYTLSPLLGPKCRFYPSCSEYALICLQRYPLLCAIKKISFRILKCNPLHSGGVDEP